MRANSGAGDIEQKAEIPFVDNDNEVGDLPGMDDGLRVWQAGGQFGTRQELANAADASVAALAISDLTAILADHIELRQ
jgi:hypothetical protein